MKYKNLLKQVSDKLKGFNLKHLQMVAENFKVDTFINRVSEFHPFLVERYSELRF